MPWHVEQGGGNCAADEWAVLNSDTGETMGCHDSEQAANAQLAALNAAYAEED